MKDDVDNKENKKPYQKPAVVFAKKIEVISAVCGSGYGGLGGICQTSTPPCTRLKNP